MSFLSFKSFTLKKNVKNMTFLKVYIIVSSQTCNIKIVSQYLNQTVNSPNIL